MLLTGRSDQSSVFQQLGSVFEVHCIKMIPPAAPNKSVLFKYFNDFRRYPVAIGNFCAFIRDSVMPVVRTGDIDIHRGPKRMNAQAIGSGNEAPVKRTTRR